MSHDDTTSGHGVIEAHRNGDDGKGPERSLLYLSGPSSQMNHCTPCSGFHVFGPQITEIVFNSASSATCCQAANALLQR